MPGARAQSANGDDPASGERGLLSHADRDFGATTASAEAFRYAALVMLLLATPLDVAEETRSR